MNLETMISLARISSELNFSHLANYGNFLICRRQPMTAANSSTLVIYTSSDARDDRWVYCGLVSMAEWGPIRMFRHNDA